MEKSAVELFRSGFNCSQSVLGAHAGALGLDPGTAARLASGLGAGLGRKQEVCGAVTGAVLALGLRYGHAEASDSAGKERTYRLVRDLQDRFAEAHGTTVCRRLLGVDLLSDEGQRALKAGDLMNTVCAPCVETADRLVRELFRDNP